MAPARPAPLRRRARAATTPAQGVRPADQVAARERRAIPIRPDRVERHRAGRRAPGAPPEEAGPAPEQGAGLGIRVAAAVVAAPAVAAADRPWTHPRDARRLSRTTAPPARKPPYAPTAPQAALA